MIPLILGDPPALPSEKHLSDSARPPLAVEARKEVPGCWLKSKTVLYLSLFDKIIFAPFNWYVKKKKKKKLGGSEAKSLHSHREKCL